MSERPIALPSEGKKERDMIDRPHFASYSIPARICLGIGIFSAALLAVTMLTNAFAMS